MNANGQRRPAWALVLALGGATGCYQGLGEVPEAAGTDDEAGESAGGADDAGDDGSEVAECNGEPVPAIALRFLTRTEYDNTIRDLLGDSYGAAAAFAADEEVGGYFANSTLAPSSTQIERFLEAAESLATVAVTERLDRFVDCTPSESGCAEEFITQFGSKAFRRPLTAQEQDAYADDFYAIAGEQGEPLGLQVVAEAMLASPHFLYVGERSELDGAEARAYDLASRLSYFVWATMPDDALLDAAASGRLGTRDDVEQQVRRMLEDPRAADMLASFSTQWVEVGELSNRTTKNPENFPEWSPSLADAAEREVVELMRRVVMEGDARLETLLQSRDAWVDDDLASLYGVPAPEGGAGWVELPADERSGVLSRAAFLAGHAHADENSWVHRGKVVRERLLCGTLPPPPAMADDNPIINDESRLEDPACAGCHLLMDPIGVGFEGYDPIGRFTGGSAPGTVNGIEQPQFDGAVELSESLATSPEVTACFAEQMYRYANRRPIESGDACAIEALAAEFAGTEGDIVELVVALVTADGFTGEGLQ